MVNRASLLAVSKEVIGLEHQHCWHFPVLGAMKQKKQGENSLDFSARCRCPFLVPQTSSPGAPIAACILTAAFLPFLPQCSRPSTLIFQQKCCNN